MFDNSMTGVVGFAMHEDRLAQAAQNLRLVEAERAMARRTERRNTSRERAAQALMVLALRLSPGITVERLALAE
jgi:hypothetical protein